MFIIVETRPDIAFVTAERHSSGMRDLGRYLRSIINQKIKYKPVADSDSNLKLYSDADWANIQGRKSISGHVAILYKGLVAWGSKKQRSGAIAFTKNPYLHERSKHIDICYYYIRDLAKKKCISVIYILTIEMVTDGFTKPLERILFTKFKSMLGLVDSNAKSQ
ncbi:Copia protein [Lachnellula suecica]|uniref:Copia protein n=1 Tax=Lachnellula suecica TaxID=602035 RepID=A0A8T9BR18_9HELO|nr:Copia protein [Lachnellula suecica]